MTEANQRIDGSANAEEKVSALPAWKVILKMIQFRPWLWLRNLGAMLFLMLGFQLPALAMRAFFDLLTDEAQASLGIWALLAMLFASEASRILGIFGLVSTNVPFFLFVTMCVGVSFTDPKPHVG